MNNLPILKQFPIQNERAHKCGAFPKSGTESESSPGVAGKVDEKLYLTLNDFETYLWKFRRNRTGASVTGGGSGTQSDAWSSPKKPGNDVAPPGTAVKSGPRRAEKTEAEEEKGERQRVRVDDAKVPVPAGAVAPSRCFVTIDASD